MLLTTPITIFVKLEATLARGIVLQFIIVFTLIYILGLPLILVLISVAHQRLRIKWAMRKQGVKHKARLKQKPEPLTKLWKERLGLAVKDTRKLMLPGKKSVDKPPSDLKINRKQVLFGLYLLGLFCYVVAGWQQYGIFLILGTVLFFMAFLYGVLSPRKVLTIRQQRITRMKEIAQLKLGSLKPEDGEPVQVLKWDDLIEPKCVRFLIPTGFSSDNEDAFLRHFNQFFGTEVAWVATKEDGYKGWNYADGEVTLATVPPLPTMAPWSAHYVDHEAVAWSWFPIGLGVRGGVELVNPETGEKENVLGFDVSGLQPDLAKEKGVVLDDACKNPAPMILASGGTGSGKSLSRDTLVAVKK